MDTRSRRQRHIVWDRPPVPQHVGLALGGGAARGMAHVGVLQVLEEHHIPLHCIAGTSAGSSGRRFVCGRRVGHARCTPWCAA